MKTQAFRIKQRKLKLLSCAAWQRDVCSFHEMGTPRSSQQKKDTMIITAKFSTTCPCCSIRIDAGSRVEWVKGAPARHAACAAKPATATSTSAKPATRRQPMGSGHGQAGRVAGYSSYCTDNASCGCYDCAS